MYRVTQGRPHMKVNCHFVVKSKYNPQSMPSWTVTLQKDYEKELLIERDRYRTRVTYVVTLFPGNL